MDCCNFADWLNVWNGWQLMFANNPYNLAYAVGSTLFGLLFFWLWLLSPTKIHITAASGDEKQLYALKSAYDQLIEVHNNTIINFTNTMIRSEDNHIRIHNKALDTFRSLYESDTEDE